MGPRTALVLMIPTGAQLGALAGWLPLGAVEVTSIWALALAWLALVWYVYLTKSASRALKAIDRALRYVLVCAAVLFGAGAFAGWPVELPRWLGAKLLAYGGAVATGLALRKILAQWAVGFAELEEEHTRERGSARIEAAMAVSLRYGRLLWVLVGLAAFMSVTKPIW
jgi:hypothetical protein